MQRVSETTSKLPNPLRFNLRKGNYSIFNSSRYVLIILFVIVVTNTLFADNPIAFKLIVFEGSDWCPNCIHLEKKVLNDSVFIEFLHQNNIAIERIDFPQHKKLGKDKRLYNSQMAEKYSFVGSFPTILLVESNLDKTIELSYENQSINEFVRQIQSKIYAFK